MTAVTLGVRTPPGRPPIEALLQALAPKRALLILDNCEYLLNVCADLVETLLRGCRDLHILTTSRYGKLGSSS